MATPVHVKVHVPIHPTEDPRRVETAIRSLFPDADVDVHAAAARAEGGSLAKLTDLIDAHRIPDTARAVMLGGRDAMGARTIFRLGKQAAFVGKPHFAPPSSPLGDLEVTLEADSPLDLERAIYETAHDTTVPLELARIPPVLREGPPPDPPEARNTND